MWISTQQSLIPSTTVWNHVENVSELITKREELKSQLNNIENSDEALAALQQRLSDLQTQAKKEADILTKRRQKTAQQIEKEMQSRLIPLGMPNVRFSIQITKDTLGRTGQDKVAFLFSANTSTPLQPVSQVASGGEIARVMLSLKAMISGAVKLPTIIFSVRSSVSPICRKLLPLAPRTIRLRRKKQPKALSVV